MNSKSRKITYADIAKEAGVSTATVSRVINQRELVKTDTLQKIISAMQNLGCSTTEFLSSNIKSNESSILCVVPGIGNPFYSDILSGIKTAAKEAGHTLLIVDEIIDENNINKVMSVIASNHIFGLIPLGELSTQIIDRLTSIIPVVQCCEYNESSDASYVSIDNIKATHILMNYILGTNHKKIAIVTTDPKKFFYSRLRLKGYYSALENFGIEINPNWVIYLPEISFSRSVAAISTLLQLDDRPDCLFCVSDLIAAAAIQCCKKAKLDIPNDIMVVGFDNIDISVITSPTITTVNQPRFDIGYSACKLLTEAISNPDAPTQHILFETEFIIRESTMSGYIL